MPNLPSRPADADCNVARLMGRLQERDCAFFFDIDGTISHLAPSPEEAFIVPEILTLLHRLDGLGVPVALISGRALGNIDALSFPYRFAAAGQHGQEVRLPDGAVSIGAKPECRHMMTQASDAIIAFTLGHPALRVEVKDYSTAVHYRQAPHLEHDVKRFMASLARDRGEVFTLQDGKMVCELRLKGGDKGSAIGQIAGVPPFHGKVPVFVGDDATDEAGFVAVNGLNGASIKIGKEPTHAAFRMANVAQLQGWLTIYVNLLSERKTHE